MSNQCRIDVKSMPNRPLTRGGRGGFEGGVWGGAVPNKPLTTVVSVKNHAEIFPSEAETVWGRSLIFID